MVAFCFNAVLEVGLNLGKYGNMFPKDASGILTYISFVCKINNALKMEDFGKLRVKSYWEVALWQNIH
jgi:hypothetical protein